MLHQLVLSKNSERKLSLSQVLPYAMVIMGAIFYCYEYLLRVSPSVMSTDLMRHYHIDAFKFSHLNAFYYYIYAPMQIPVGLLMDKYGPRRLLSLAAFCCSFGTYLYVCTDNIMIAELGRFLVGFGSSFAYVGTLKLASMWLPANRFGLVSGVCMALGMCGAVMGDIILTSLVHRDGWQAASYHSVYIGFIIMAALMLIVRDQPKNTAMKTHQATTSFRELLKSLKELLHIKDIWYAGLIGCFIWIPHSMFAELFGIDYLKVTYNLSATQAAHINALIFIGWAVGGPIVTSFSDYLKSRKIPIRIGSFCAMLVFCYVLSSATVSQSVLAVLLFLFGFFSSVQVIVFPIAHDLSKKENAASALAFINMFVMTSGMLFTPLAGKILTTAAKVGGHYNIAEMIYKTSDYQTAFIVIPVVLFITFLVTFCIKETYCRNHQ